MPANGEPGTAAGTQVKSITMALKLLEVLANSGVPLGVTELANQLGESKAKIHRHLATMRRSGIVEQARTSDKYRLGWKLFELGQAAFDQVDLRDIAVPHMVNLRDALNQTTVLAVPVGGEAMVIASLDQVGGWVKVSGVPGSIAPPTASAQGRVILAYASKRRQEEMLKHSGAPPTPYSITDPDEIRDRLEMIRQRFYDYAPQETMLGINAAAAPIFGSDEKLVGTVMIMGSILHLPDPPADEQLRALLACAAAISAELKSTTYEKIRARFEPVSGE